MENIGGGTVMKMYGLDKMANAFADFTQGGETGEVRCTKCVKSLDEVAPEWIEDDDDFRIVLRRPIAQGDLDFGADESRDCRSSRRCNLPAALHLHSLRR